MPPKRSERGGRGAAQLIFGIVFVIFATAAGAVWDLPELMQALARVETSQTRFSERKHVAILETPLVSSGVLTFRAPAELEKHVLKPSQVRYRVSADTLTIEQPDKKLSRTFVLDEQPLIWAFVEAFRATLAGDIDSLQRFYSIKLTGNAARWRLELTPRSGAIRQLLSHIRMDGTNAELRTVEIVETNGDRSVMTLTPPS